jgi:hypothetical protein
VFFVDGEPISASVGLECKRISSDDTGRLTGCAFDCVRAIDIGSRLVQETIGKMFPYYKENKISGIGDVNVILDGRKVYFVEKCERLGLDYHVTLFTNIEKKDFLNTMADIYDKTYKPDVSKLWSTSVCVYVDYPHEGIPMQVPDSIKKDVYLFDGMMKDGVLVQTGASSELMIVCGSDTDLKGAFANALEKCELLRDEIINLDYRKDCTRSDYDMAPLKRWQALSDMGYV